MKTRLLLAALATTAAAFALPGSSNVPEAASTLPLLAVGAVTLGFLARRLRK